MGVADYEVTGEISRGGAGIVYRARSRDGRDVAIKVLRASVDPEALARFDRERRVLAALGENEGFVPLIEAGMAPQGPFIVMPFISGGTLRDRLKRGPLAIDEAIELGRTLASALGRAHGLGIIHRDLKPENVLYTAPPEQGGRALIADLGLAKRVHGGIASVASRSNEFSGTPSYMPPEQMFDSKHVTPAADVFALGAIIYECLAGQRAFPADTMAELVKLAKLGRPATPVRSLRRDTPAWLAEAVERALAKDPAERFADGRELSLALVAPPSAVRLSPRILAVTGSAVVVVASVAFSLGRAGHLREPPPSPPVAVAPPPVSKPVEVAKKPPPPPPPPAPPAKRTPPPPPPPVVPPTERAERLALEAWQLLHEGKDGEAQERANEAIQVVARDRCVARAYAVAGMLMVKKGLVQGALDSLNEATVLDPTIKEAWFQRGMLLKQKADDPYNLGQADVCFGHAIELAPGEAALYGERCGVRMALGKKSEALADASKAIELDPSGCGGWAFANRAVILYQGNDHEKAHADAERSTQLNPTIPVAWLILALCRWEKKELDPALVAVEKAIALQPENLQGFKLRAQIHRAKEEFTAALGDCDSGLKVDADDAELRMLRGELKSKLGDAAGAAADLERGLELMPDHPQAAEIRGVIAELKEQAKRKP